MENIKILGTIYTGNQKFQLEIKRFASIRQGSSRKYGLYIKIKIHFFSQMFRIGILLKYRENLSSSLIASEFPRDYLDHPNTFWEALDNDYGNQAKPDNK